MEGVEVMWNWWWWRENNRNNYGGGGGEGENSHLLKFVSLCYDLHLFCLDIRCLALNRMFPIRRSRNKRPKELEIHEHP